MKKIMVFILMVSSFSAFASFTSSEEKVIKVLSDFKHKEEIEIQEDTFIPNILGYACPVPAIDVGQDVFHFTALRHNRYRFSDEASFALKVANPNMRFCDWPSPLKVFGDEYVVGKVLTIEIRTLLEITEQHDGTQDLRETVSTDFLGESLNSIARVPL